MTKRMLVARTLVLALLLALLLSANPYGAVRHAAAQESKPIVRLFFFYSETCPHCMDIIEGLLPPLWDQYGGQLEIRFFEVNVDHNYLVLGKLEDQYHVSAEEWPAVFIGRDVLDGTTVEKRLPTLVAQYLAAGGCDWPSDDWAVGPTPVVPRRPTPTPGPSPTPGPTFTPPATIPPGTVVIVPTPWPTWTPTPGASRPTPTIKVCAHCGEDTPTPTPRVMVYMAYFYDPSCPECQRAERDLTYLSKYDPDLVIVRFNIQEQNAKGTAAVLGERLGVPIEKRIVTPMVIIGQDYLVDGDVTLRAMQDLVQKYHTQGGAQPTWENITDEERIRAILGILRMFSPLAVLGAGLIDGLNPCAFATLIFFVSYLTFTGRKGREVLLVGGVFTATMFVTYLLIGAGILSFLTGLRSLSVMDMVTRIIYSGTALVCAVFGVLSLYDLAKVLRGQPAEMTLQLPDFLKRRTRQLIREESRGAEVKGTLWGFLVAAVVAGFGITVLELVCTGQVYLPTIVFIMGVPELAAQGFLYLVLYNLMFVTPLIVVFALAYFGTSSQQLGAFLNKRLALVKGLTAVLFFALAAWLILALP